MAFEVFLLSSALLRFLPWEDIFIVDGNKASLGQIPYQVSLQINGSHYCGGVLIDSQTVLTAAHCFDYYPPTTFTVVAGVVDLKNTGQISKVNHAIIHSGHKRVSFHNDIAVVKTETPFITSSYVAAILLPNTDFTPTGNATVSGWGKTRENGPMSQTLLDAQLVVMTEEQCRDIYGEEINSSVFCAGPQPGGHQDACQGDSGGPVICEENGNKVLCGLVSTGIGCGDEDSPGIYTSVPDFIQWIHDNR